MSISLRDDWSDIHVDSDAASIGYRSGLTVFEEALVRGQLVARSWNAAGFLSAWDDVRFDPAEHPMPQSFGLEIDGQSLGSHWSLESMERREVEGGHEGIVRLHHDHRPVRVAVHTRLDGTPVMARWLEVTNSADRPAALSSVAPWSGLLQRVKRWTAHVADPTEPLFSVGYLAGDRWADEGRFEWHPLPSAGFRIDGRYRRDRYRHPMFVLRNHATGEHVVGQLAWSGGYTFEFDLDADPVGGDGAARLWFRAGPDGPAPQRILDSGETVATPAVHLGMVFGDLDAAIQAMHRHIRRSVVRPQARGHGGWIESGIGPEVEITEAIVHQQIEASASLGAEVFFLDASWYTPPNGSWYDTVGDWEVDRERYPQGLAPFRDHARERGMLFGLWMDPERIGRQSNTAADHPDWLAVGYDGQARLGDMLDLTRPEVAAWVEDRIGRVIADNELDFFRLDWNVGTLRAGAQTVRHGFVESAFWRYSDAFYAMFDRLRERFPDVILEHCAGGGGRTDLGMAERFSHTWVTDWQIAPRAFRITNGMTMALPPELVDRLLGGQNGHTTADLDFQARLLLFARPTVVIIDPLGAARNPLQVERIRHMVDLYTGFVRPFSADSRMFHHTPTTVGIEPRGWGVLELASGDGSRAIVGAFRLSGDAEPTRLVHPRGLRRDRRYEVTWDDTGEVHERDGADVMATGLRVRLEGALTSELIRLEAIEP